MYYSIIKKKNWFNIKTLNNKKAEADGILALWHYGGKAVTVR